MTLNKVIWAEAFSEEKHLAEELYSGELELNFYERPVQKLDLDELPDEFILTTRTHSNFSDVLLKKSACIISRSTGYDHLTDIKVDFPVGYLPDYATEAVAGHNLSVAFSLIRKISTAQRAMKDFSRNELTGREISKFTAGIVGVGRIGRATAERLRKLDVTVKGNDLDPRPDWAEKVGLEYVKLQELFKTCNLIFLALPLTEKTAGLIDRKLLFDLPENSYLVNAGRGEVVNSTHLLTALDEGPLAGLGLDVYNYEGDLAAYLSGEPVSVSSRTEAEIKAVEELLTRPNVIATPHNAFNTRSALQRKVKSTLASIKQFQATGDLPAPVPKN